MEQTAEVREDTNELSSGVEEETQEILEENSGEDLQELDESRYIDSDLTSLSDDEFNELKNKVFNKKEDTTVQVAVEKKEPTEKAEEAPIEPPPEKEVAEPQRAQATEDPRLRETLSQVGQTYQGLEQQEKTLIQQVHAARTRANELAEDNPREAVKFDQRAEQFERDLQQIAEQKRQLVTYATNLQTVSQAVPQEFLRPEPMIEALMESHGMNFDQASKYVREIMWARPSNEVISLAHQAVYREAAKKLMARVDELEKAMKGSNSKPKSSNEVAKIINKAKSIPKTLTPVPTSSEEVDINPNELALMSDEEFEKLKRQVLKNG